MPSSELEVPLHLEPRPSRRLWACVVITHVVALAVIVPLSAQWPGVVVTLGLLLDLSLLHQSLRLWSGACPRGLRSAVLEADGQWRLVDARGRAVSAQLLDSSIVLPGIAILHFRRDGGAREALVLVGDSLDQDRMRRLRVRLRTQRRTGQDIDPTAG